ncbi:hypothetical protein [Legionella israelensis]|uniref:hypothetical protein n=1 Tax=Legionella israelensis TaxID=454 RepID=UPI001431838F|nr:hypothetical protein [Legionella israelensis]
MKCYSQTRLFASIFVRNTESSQGNFSLRKMKHPLIEPLLVLKFNDVFLSG